MEEPLFTNRGLPQRAVKMNATSLGNDKSMSKSSTQAKGKSQTQKATPKQISKKSGSQSSSSSQAKSGKGNKKSTESSRSSSKSSQNGGANKLQKKRKQPSSSTNSSGGTATETESRSSSDEPSPKRAKTSTTSKSKSSSNASSKTDNKKDQGNGEKKINKIKSPLPRLPKGQEPRGYERIDRNTYPCRPKRKWAKDEVIVCECRLRPGQQEGCTVGCLNRVLLVECVEEHCPCGDKCANQRFQLMQYAPIRPIQAGDKGWGIIATARIPKGSFVIEYVGEVIDAEELEDRAETYINDKHFYFLTLDANECIDARRKGNWARFINHSCDPNCQTQKWMVNGEVRIGIFAMRDILEGEELTFDYQFERFGKKKQRCLCGSPNCCQFIGGKIEKPAQILDPDMKIKTKMTRHQTHTQTLLEEQKSAQKADEPFKVFYQPLFTPAGIKRAAENRAKKEKLKEAKAKQEQTKNKKKKKARADSSDSEDEFDPLPGVNRSELSPDTPVFLRRNAELVRYHRLKKYQHFVYLQMEQIKHERDQELLDRKERSRQRKRENNLAIWANKLMDPRAMRNMKNSGAVVLEN